MVPRVAEIARVRVYVRRASLIVLAATLALLLYYTETTSTPFPTRSGVSPQTKLRTISHQDPDIMEVTNRYLRTKPSVLAKAFREDMERCSRAMGMSDSTLNNDTHREVIEAVSQQASTFASWVRTIVPEHFSPDFKNPCWYTSDVEWISNHSHVNNLSLSSGKLLVDRMKNYFDKENTTNTQLCMPYFFIAGFPKCGTTTLHVAMSRDPDIYAPQWKEPHWWVHANEEDSIQWLAAYFMLFRTRNGELSKDVITYDASPDVLWRSRFVSNVTKQDYCAMPAVVKRILPKAKFIVMMREPMSAVYSSFLYTNSGSRLNLGLPNQFHTKATTYIAELNSCLAEASLYECTGMINSGRGIWDTFRFSIELYHVHLKKWLQFYAREQFLFLRTEDMFTDPGAVMQKITSFLGISTLTEDQVKILFAKKHNVNSAAHTKAYEMLPETRQLLQNLYRSHNEKLAELLNDDKFLWQDYNIIT